MKGQQIKSTDMFFRAHYTLRNFDLGDLPTVNLYVPVNDSTPIRIELSKIPKEQLWQGQKEGDIRCIATVEKNISKKQSAQFESLSGEPPVGIRNRANEIIIELRSAVKQGVRVFMWKRGLLQVHNFIKPGISDLQYSFDGDLWKLISGQVSLSYVWSITPKSSEEAESNKLLSESYSQPLGHELLSEAWSLQDYSFRSALVIGIAAAETGFKEFVNRLTPDAGWLIANIPSPPLVKMITQYLPTFQTKLLLDGKVLPPPKSIIDILITGVNLRNEVSHGKASSMTKDTLTNILRAVRDLLYLLDYYSGHAWALSMIRVAIVNEMKAELEKNSNR